MKGMSVCAVLVALASAAPVSEARQDRRKDRAWDFGADEIDKVPAGWSLRRTNPPKVPVTAPPKATPKAADKQTGKGTTKKATTWHVVTDSTAPSHPNVLTVINGDSDAGTFNLALADGSLFKDLDLSIQIKPMSGTIDQGGGAVWRVQDENNYYVSRFNPLESNFRIYYVKDGRRHQLQSAEVYTETGFWYRLRVTMMGDDIVCYLDGKKLLEVTDHTFPNAGMVGLWTKADAVTRFDDLQVAPPRRQGTSLLAQRQTIALPGVKGRLEHLALDGKGNRLFLAAPENATVEVIDLTSGERIHSIDGLSEPHGVVYLPKSQRVVVACAGDGSVRSFDTDTFKEVARYELGDDAGDIRWDASSNLLYVGFGKGALGILDANDLTKKGEIKVGGHPESFQIDHSTDRIYVNVPDAGQIVVIDRKTHTVVARWKIAGAAENHPMALDEAEGTLFVACRKPPRMLAFDTFVGARLATVPCAADADGIFLDKKRKRIYVVGGEGFVDILVASTGRRRFSRSAYARTARVATSPGARTALFNHERGLLYVAAPAREQQEARVLVYQTAH